MSWVNPYYFVGHTSTGRQPWWNTDAPAAESQQDVWKQQLQELQLETSPQAKPLSGWIDIQMTTKGFLSFGDPERTWHLPIGDTADPTKTHRVSDFFTVNGKLAIPGSELKGMLRTNMEAVLDARAGVLNVDEGKKDQDGNEIPYSYRLVKGKNVTTRNVGILWCDNGNYKIQRCTFVKIRRDRFIKNLKNLKFSGDFNRLKPAAQFEALHGQKITREVHDTKGAIYSLELAGKKVELEAQHFTFKGKENWRDGFIYIPRDYLFGDDPDRTNEPVSKNILVFIPLTKTTPLDCPPDIKTGPNKRDGGVTAAEKADTNFNDTRLQFSYENDPKAKCVRYATDKNGNVTSLGAVALYRLPEEYTYAQVLRKDTFLLPADKKCKLDPVSRLFGWVPPDGKSEGAFMGRLSFEPLMMSDSDSVDALTGWKTLPIRGEPKPEYYPFYLQSGNSPLGRYSEGAARLRGRKFYWHFPPDVRTNEEALLGDWQQANRVSNQNATERLCKHDKEFTSRIYFTNLEPWELGALLWTMTFSTNPFTASDQHGHHIGGGAATGLGSVQFEVLGIHTVNHADEWASLDADGICKTTPKIAAEWVTRFIETIGEHIRLAADGESAANSALKDWYDGHKLDALEKFNAASIGYRMGVSKDGQMQAPPYFGKQRGERTGQTQGNEEPLKSTGQILNGKGQEDPTR